MKATVSPSSPLPRPARTLTNPEERRRNVARRRAGQVFAFMTLIPVVLAVSLIVVLLFDTVVNAVSWQVVEPSSSVSGESFSWSRAPLGGDAVTRLELAAQGLSAAEIEAFFADDEQLRTFEVRNRIELMWRTQEGPWRWVVTSSRDGREVDIGLFGVNAYLQQLRGTLAAEEPQDLEPQQQALLQNLQNADLERGVFGSFANVGLLAQTLEAGQNLYLNPWLDASFFSKNASRTPTVAGLRTALAGTLWMMGLVILMTVPAGVGAAIYLEEYAPPNRFSRFLEVNIRNLAAIPSIVYGILGLYVFVRLWSIGPTILAAALTLSLLVLPVVIIAAREAIRAVPSMLRQASYGLGATKWQTVSRVVLPNAVTGIVTGVILALARAIGETAPLLLVGAAAFVAYIPDGPLSRYTVIPVQIYTWIAENNVEFRHVASAGILTLLLVLFMLYGIAFYIRRRFERVW